MKSPLPRSAVQLFSLRTLLRDTVSLKVALRRLKEGGYSAVESVALDFLPGADLAGIIRAAGLDCCSHYVPAWDIFGQPHTWAREVKRFGCDLCVTGLPPGERLASLADARDWGRRLGQAALALPELGLTLAYHPHQWEYQLFDGQLALDALCEAAGPALMLELDTYWLQRCGVDPAAECARLAGKVPLLHLKDLVAVPGADPQTAAVGQGSVDWPAVLEASARAGGDWWVVEQSHFRGDPVEELLSSLRFLGALAVAPLVQR